MNRRTVYSSEQERNKAIERSRSLVNKLWHHSQLSYENLSLALKKIGVSISAGMLRQIASGKKPASSGKLYQLALAAKTLGHFDDNVKKIIAEGNPTDPESLNWFGIPAALYQEPGNKLADIKKAEKLAQHHAVLRLEKALLDLLPWGWTDIELLYIVLALLERMPIDHIYGGMVNPDTLPIRRANDPINISLFVSTQVSDS